MSKQRFIFLLTLSMNLFFVFAQKTVSLSGNVISTDQSIIDFATIYLKGTNYGCYTNEKGEFHFNAPSGSYVLIVSAMGFHAFEKEINIKDNNEKLSISLTPSITTLDEVIVTSNGINRIKQSAYNSIAIDAKTLHNTTKTLSDALSQAPGVKLRESGGVGSDTQIMLDGFSGKHIKVFIDGIPQEGSSTSFNLNNVPINFAERIEVYRGVVPVEFGTDALGGVINIVTNKKRNRWFTDASYSYGSFNTHKSHINFGQKTKKGLFYEINAFQNYSDNNYDIDNYVTIFGEDDITESTDKNKIYRVKRFNDTFHNEAVIGKVGIVDKNWTDLFAFSLTYSHFYKEIQTGVYQYVVFGQKHRKGHSFIPSIEYRKHDLFTKNLNLTFTANYNHNITHNIDTASYKYNWFGDKKYTGTPGEQSHLNNESKNTNWNSILTVNYHINHTHLFTVNHVTSTFHRTVRSYIAGSTRLSDFSIPKKTRKNISGLSYKFMPSKVWNLSVFGKYYNQYNEGPISQNDDGIGNYIQMKKHNNSIGYGIAGTYFFLKNFQTKLSYEKAYRLPTTEELFGDDDLEAGKTNLRPEKSDNINWNISYESQMGKHNIYVEGSVIYRDTKDYIKRGLSQVNNMSFGFYENHGRVKTKGYNISLRYNYDKWFNMGGTYNSLNARDNEKYRAKETQQISLTYGQRIPNQPYQYASFDASFFYHDLFAKGNKLSLTYDGFYQHAFPLYWENLGDPDTKIRVPKQISHNISIGYSIKNGRYNLSFECKNLTNAKLYDNFSLQKAGRAFYGKIRAYFGKQ